MIERLLHSAGPWALLLVVALLAGLFIWRIGKAPICRARLNRPPPPPGMGGLGTRRGAPD